MEINLREINRDISALMGGYRAEKLLGKISSDDVDTAVAEIEKYLRRRITKRELAKSAPKPASLRLAVSRAKETRDAFRSLGLPARNVAVAAGENAGLVVYTMGHSISVETSWVRKIAPQPYAEVDGKVVLNLTEVAPYKDSDFAAEVRFVRKDLTSRMTRVFDHGYLVGHLGRWSIQKTLRGAYQAANKKWADVFA